MAYGMGVVRGMLMTLQHVFRPPITVNYPEYQREVPVRARTNLLWFEERCTGCSTCAQACPDGCILVETSPREDGTLNITRYEIDFRICMYCGLCTEACPYQAIQAGGRYNDAVYVFENMYRDREALTAEAETYMARTGGVYPNGQTQELVPLITSMPTARSRVDVAGAGGPFGPQRLPGKLDRPSD
ncbi:MAG: NADH-quinone oxidoreductase subunit I [Chloroflexi bacterium]|nr:NADH-quinone oxidoreductase subunit I [Chloroflexota bacterium]MDA1004622.1 NADH-quinone oxidoreductase subunit I [Chloroflexota bacterium]